MDCTARTVDEQAHDRAGLPPRLDLFDPELLDNPYPIYERLRSAGPVARVGAGSWAITRYAEVSALLHDARLGHAAPADLDRRLATTRHAEPHAIAGAGPDAELTNVIASMDGRRHARIRALMRKALTQVVTRRLTWWFESTVDNLLARAIARGRFDAVTDVAYPLQLALLSRVVGIPPADRDELARRAMEVGRAIILRPFVSPASRGGAAEARWLREAVSEVVNARRRRPEGDLVSRLLAVTEQGARLSHDEVVDNTAFVCFAGFETSMYLIAGTFAALATFRDQWNRLRRSPGLVSLAVEELLRYDAPLQWVSRITQQPIGIGDRVLKSGRLILLLLGSANHDERQFVAADGLDVGRHPNRHVTFGPGPHQCIGVMPVRLQAAIVLRQLLARCATLELEREPVRRPHPNIRSFVSVPIVACAA